MPGQKFQKQKQKLKRTTVSCPAPSLGLKHLIPPVLRVLAAKCAHLRLTLGISLRWEAALFKVMPPFQDHIQWAVPAVMTQSCLSTCRTSLPAKPSRDWKDLLRLFFWPHGSSTASSSQSCFLLFYIGINPESSPPQNSCMPGYPPSWVSLMTQT